MVAEIISGKEVAKTIREELTQKVANLKSDKNVTPGLAVILVGEDPASVSYVTAKGKAADELGIFEETYRMPEDTSEEDVLAKVEELNNDPRFHGILVQLPLPKHIDEEKVSSETFPYPFSIHAWMMCSGSKLGSHHCLSVFSFSESINYNPQTKKSKPKHSKREIKLGDRLSIIKIIDL